MRSARPAGPDPVAGPDLDTLALFLEAILENASGPIAIKDTEGRLILVNRQFSAIHGREPEDLAGLHISELYPPERVRFFLDKDRELIEEGEPRQNEVQALTVDGERRDLLTQRFPVRDRDGRIFAIGTINADVTHLKRVEAELERYRDHLDREIAVRTAELQALVAQKDRLFSIIAQDLREAFNILLGYSETLAGSTDRMQPEAIAEAAALVHESGQQAYKLLENLLIWSRLQMGKIEMSPRAVPVDDALRRAAAVLGGRAAEKHLKVETPADTTPLAHVDPPSLETVLRNLLSNAVKFTEPGGRIVAEATMSDSAVVVTIRDSGRGMTEDLLGRLFRVDEPMTLPGTAGETGTGMGLILCRDLLERQGGSLTIESEEGVGTTVRVVLPAAGAG